MYVCAYAHRSQSSARSPPRRRHAFLHRSDFVSLQSGLKQILEETEEEEAIDIDILPLSKEKKKKTLETFLRRRSKKRTRKGAVICNHEKRRERVFESERRMGEETKILR